MATVPINQAASANFVTPQQPAKTSTGFPSELHALMSLADIPDPGGGPPVVTAEGRASIPGPNAQSNQPDFLPLLESAGLPLQPIGGSPLGGTPTKGAKSTSPDPTLIALSGMVGNGILPTTVGMTEPGPAQVGVVSVTTATSGSAPAQAITAQLMPAQAIPAQLVSAEAIPADATLPPLIPNQATPSQATPVQGATAKAAPPLAISSQTAVAPTPTASAAPGTSQVNPTQPPTQREEMVQVIVDAPAVSRASQPLPAIQNAIVSAVATKDTAPTSINVPIAAAATPDGQWQGASGNPTGDQPSNHQTATPDPTAANVASTLPAAGQSAPVASSSPTAAPTLSDPQRLDVVRQVADRIELMAAARPQQGVTIHLQPHGLGDVTIVVKGIGKDIEATFSATNSTVRNALADSRDALTEAVTAKGYNLVGVNIAAHSQSMTGRDRQSSANQQQQSQAFGNPSNGGGPNGGNNLRGRGLPSAVSTATGTENDAEHPLIGVEGVDYRI